MRTFWNELSLLIEPMLMYIALQKPYVQLLNANSAGEIKQVLVLEMVVESRAGFPTRYQLNQNVVESF